MGNIEDFFAANVTSGVGIPSIELKKVGDKVVGEIVDVTTGVVTTIGSTEPKLDKNGNTMPQIAITLQTALRNWEGANKVPTDEDGNAKPASEDDGQRRVFVKYSSNIGILQAAIVASGATVGDLAPGAKLAVKFDKEEPMPTGALKVMGFQFKKGNKAVEDVFATAEESKPEPKAEEKPAAPAAEASPWSDDEPPF